MLSDFPGSYEIFWQCFQKVLCAKLGQNYSKWGGVAVAPIGLAFQWGKYLLTGIIVPLKETPSM